MGPGPARGGDALLTASARCRIRCKVAQLCSKPGFSRSDAADLEQELTAALVQQAGRYDPLRGASVDTFAHRVIESAALMILRARRQLKRAGGYRARWLEQGSVPVRGQSVPVAELVQDAPSGDGMPPAEHAAAAETHALLNQVLAGLPGFHAAVARHLLHHSATTTAKLMGVSRRQVRAAVADIRRRCDDAGLGDGS